MCYTFLNTENCLGLRAKIGKGRDGPRLARSLIIFQEFSNFPFSNVLPTARLFIYCSTSRCLTLYHDFQPRCKRHKPLSKEKPRMKDRGKKERKKKKTSSLERFQITVQTSVLNAQGRHLIIPQEFSNFPFYRHLFSTFTEGFFLRKQETVIFARTYRDG